MQIRQLFHKKVHPEISKSAYASKEPKYSKYEKKKQTLSSSNSHVDPMLSSEKTRITCWGTLKKKNNHCSHTDMKLPQDENTKNNMDLPLQDISDGAGREHWIDTDEECKCASIIIVLVIYNKVIYLYTYGRLNKFLSLQKINMK